MACVAALASCRSTTSGTRYERHGSGEIWSQGFSAQYQHPEQWVPATTLLVATPVLAIFDHTLQQESSEDQPVTEGNTSSGDFISLALGGSALALGGVEALRGDHGQSFEVAAESLIATGTATEILKRTTNRSRPTGNSNDSFPSGHTSFSFAAATFLARRIDDSTDEPSGKLGYLLYLPATYVAIDRVEANRHWPSDVAAGALLGIVLTNWIYNAHYPDPEGERPTIYSRPKKLSWSLSPVVMDRGIGIGLDVSF